MDTAGLNPPQREAVEHGEGPLLILAGAGSGKTRVITHRLARLVTEKKVKPWRILAVTFTNKAAGEMRERAARLLGEEARRLWIGTFHATCAKLLRVYAKNAGLRPDFLIFDDDDQRRLVMRVMRDLGFSDRVATPRAILSAIDRAKNAGIAPDQYRGEDFFSDIVASVYVVYQQRLRSSNAVDFNDLLLEMLRLCEDGDFVGDELAERFDHVLVDEFQDTNRVQYHLVRHLSRRHGNLCVVGDDDQSIYRWRGADLRNILDFEADHPGCHTVKLEQNYRSTQIILEAANAVIAKNRDRKQKRLFTENGAGDAILYYTATDERAEARFVVQAIRSVEENEERSYDQFAVFYRTHAQSRVLEEALRAADIPYTIVGGTRFYDRAEVKDLLGYLRVIANPADEVSLERIVNVPARGIGDSTIDKLRAFAKQRETGLWAAMHATVSGAMGQSDVLGTGPRKKLYQFVALLDELRDFATRESELAEVAVKVLQRTGYLEKLQLDGTPESLDRISNLEELIGSLRDYQREAEEPSLVGYLERISLVSSVDGTTKGVALMTVHAAKGLEFPVVLITGLEEGTFPRFPRDPLAQSAQGRGPRIAEGAPREELEEERRLAYVAITRARERLFLTNAARRQRFGETGTIALTPLLDESDGMSLRESRFLSDIPDACIARPVRRPRERPRSLGASGPPARSRHAPLVEDRGDGITVEREDHQETTRAQAQSPSKQRALVPLREHVPVETYVDYGEGDGDTPAFRCGQRVKHGSFGEGRVLAVSGSGSMLKATVHFSSGTRTVVARFLVPA